MVSVAPRVQPEDSLMWSLHSLTAHIRHILVEKVAYAIRALLAVLRYKGLVMSV